MPDSILVHMLGDFTLQEEDSPSVVQANLTGKSRRLWMLIAYLIVNRDRGVPTEELIDLLWPDNAGDNPMATLQNNVSRARNLLQKEGFKDARNLFKYEDGMYYWAPQTKTLVDIDTFEAYAEQFEAAIAPKDLDTAYKACQMYQGDFLARVKDEGWCVNLRIHYQTLFLRLCSLTIELLLDEGRFAEAEALSLHAFEVSPTTEILSVFLMRSLVSNGKAQQALDHYDYISRLFETEYGARVSNELEIEKAAAAQILYGRDLNESSVRSFLSEGAKEQGAFQCSNSAFRAIVQMQMREMQREEQAAQLVVVGFDQNGLDLAKQATYMKMLEETLLSSLRIGDPFTKMSSARFLILLPSASPENGDTVMKRIMDKFRRDYPQVETEFYVFMFDLASFSDEILNS